MLESDHLWVLWPWWTAVCNHSSWVRYYYFCTSKTYFSPSGIIMRPIPGENKQSEWAKLNMTVLSKIRRDWRLDVDLEIKYDWQAIWLAAFRWRTLPLALMTNNWQLSYLPVIFLTLYTPFIILMSTLNTVVREGTWCTWRFVGVRRTEIQALNLIVQ